VEIIYKHYIGLNFITGVQHLHIINKFCKYKMPLIVILTEKRESPQAAESASENSSLGFIEAVHQWL